MRRAPAGGSTFDPTASMRSPLMTTVFFSGSAPVPSMTVAPMMAIIFSLFCLRASAEKKPTQTSIKTDSNRRFIKSPGILCILAKLRQFDLSTLIVVSAIQSNGKENVGKENNRTSIFLSYIFLSVGRNDDQGRFDYRLPASKCE